MYVVKCPYLCTSDAWARCPPFTSCADLPTNILDVRGFGSGIILILRGGLPTSIGDLPESLSRAILAGIILVGKLGVRFAFLLHAGHHEGNTEPPS